MNQVNHLTPAQRRKRRVRSKISGTADRPRLAVFRSNQHIYLQAINDATGEVIAAASDAKKDKEYKGTKIEAAEQVAEEMAEKLKKAKVKKLVFDRGRYSYHGRVKKAAETLREKGFDF